MTRDKTLNTRVASGARGEPHQPEPTPRAQPQRSRARVVIADAYPVNRRGIRAVLETDASLLVAAEVSSGHALLVACRSIHPDLVLVDLQLLGLDAADGPRVLRQLATETRVLLLDIGGDPTIVSAALSAGASGYLSKACSETDLLDAVRVVLSGEKSQTAAQISSVRPRVPGLSAREIDVLDLMARGLTNREIAARLGITVSTAKAHVARILSKLEATSRTEAVVRAMGFDRTPAQLRAVTPHSTSRPIRTVGASSARNTWSSGPTSNSPRDQLHDDWRRPALTLTWARVSVHDAEVAWDDSGET